MFNIADRYIHRSGCVISDSFEKGALLTHSEVIACFCFFVFVFVLRLNCV